MAFCLLFRRPKFSGKESFDKMKNFLLRENPYLKHVSILFVSILIETEWLGGVGLSRDFSPSHK